MKLLVACVGNIFLGDDAFGVEVAQQLSGRRFPDGVTVKDFGIRSYDLAYALMEAWDLVILVDALPRDGKPGSVYVFEPDPSDGSDRAAAFDAHSMNPVAVLQLVGALGGKIKRLLVVGCEPATVEPDANGNIGLSAPVAAAVAEAIEAIQELISRARSEPIAA